MREILFIGYVNGINLLRDSLSCFLTQFSDIRIINNSLTPINIPKYKNVRIIDMPVSLNCYQTANWARHISIEEEVDVLWWAHHDMTITDEKIKLSKAKVYELVEQNSCWGIVFTLHDVFCAYNVHAWKDVGRFDDLRFKYYTGDVDLYGRFEIAGWDLIDLGGEDVWHYGSGVIQQDSERNFIVQEFALVERILYHDKWKDNVDMDKRVI